jgi:Na+-transporting methylmalonyl-CoA/oxaloacetate decarboxylase gamma subunit
MVKLAFAMALIMLSIAAVYFLVTFMSSKVGKEQKEDEDSKKQKNS